MCMFDDFEMGSQFSIWRASLPIGEGRRSWRTCRSVPIGTLTAASRSSSAAFAPTAGCSTASRCCRSRRGFRSMLQAAAAAMTISAGTVPARRSFQKQMTGTNAIESVRSLR